MDYWSDATSCKGDHEHTHEAQQAGNTTVRSHLCRQARTQQPGSPVRGQDGAHGRPVFRVDLEHLLDQKLELVRQAGGEGRVRAPTDLQNQALPARRLKLGTRFKN